MCSVPGRLHIEIHLETCGILGMKNTESLLSSFGIRL